MSSLNISKVAIGCSSLEALCKRQQSRLAGGIVPVFTRFRPKRADELIGGSLFWILKHRIAARQTILGFDEAEERRTLIRLAPEVIAVRSLPKRAHQGWRYLSAEDAPDDLLSNEPQIEALPAALAAELAELALI